MTAPCDDCSLEREVCKQCVDADQSFRCFECCEEHDHEPGTNMADSLHRAVRKGLKRRKRSPKS